MNIIGTCLLMKIGQRQKVSNSRSMDYVLPPGHSVMCPTLFLRNRLLMKKKKDNANILDMFSLIVAPVINVKISNPICQRYHYQINPIWRKFNL